MPQEHQNQLPSINPKIQNYLKLRDHYLENAKKRINEGEFFKASELVWGAVVQTIKILALKEGKELYKHEFIEEYVRRFSNNKSKPALFALYQIAEKLHSNFYEGGLSPEVFKINYGDALRLINMLNQYY